MPAIPKSSVKPASSGTRETYALWAEAYDRDPNPVLNLSRRLMESLLVDVRDKVVVDIGCGTGHDLELVASRGAKAVGFDFTPEMLRKAAKRSAIRTRLVEADATCLPLQEAVADLLVCSFILSYVKDVEQLAEQLAQIALPGADLYVLDFHPEAQRHEWRAALDPGFNRLQVEIHELTNIKQAFDLAGFELQSLVEPKLAHPERRLFENLQRPDLYEQARHIPAIYLFHFRRRMLTSDRSRPHLISRKRQRISHLVGARYALGPHTAVRADMVVDSTRIRGIYDRPSKARAQQTQDDLAVDLTGLLLLPGLVNAHDHLSSGWPKRIHADVAPWLGGLRNLISGVTSLLHDEKLDTSEMPQFPVRLARNFVISAKHDAPSIAKDFGQMAADFPQFIDVSWCEAEALDGFVGELEHHGLLTPRTVLLGAKSMDATLRALLMKHETAVVWVPSVVPVDDGFMRGNQLVAIGTGASGERTLSQEIQAALAMNVAAEAIYSMVTSRAAGILRLRNGEGRILSENPADLLVFEDGERTPAQSLCASSPVAVIVGGRPLLVRANMLERFPEPMRETLRAITIGDESWWAEEHVVAAVRGTRNRGRDLLIGGKAVRS